MAYPEQMPYSNAYKETTNDEAVATGMLLGRKTIRQWEEGGHLWRVDQIEPKQVGASLRLFELFMDGEPAGGGRYHATLEHVFERAQFVAQGSMSRQITYLWGLVNKYRRTRREDKEAMRQACEFIENTLGTNDYGTTALLRERLDAG